MLLPRLVLSRSVCYFKFSAIIVRVNSSFGRSFQRVQDESFLTHKEESVINETKSLKKWTTLPGESMIGKFSPRKNSFSIKIMSFYYKTFEDREKV